MRIAGLIKNSVVNGVGIRDVIFTQGCSHHCKGCHNPHTWNSKGGEEVTAKEIADQLKNSNNNVTISGGEPLEQIQEVTELLSELHKQGKDAWLYTGYTFENIGMGIWLILYANGVTVVVDGTFQEDKKDLTLQFRGSSNQRLIDLEKSLKAGHVVLWEG